MSSSLKSTLDHWLLRAIACLVMAIAGGAWAFGSINSIDTYRSPLTLKPPAPEESPGRPVARQVVFVLIDALRYDTSLNPQVMPELNRLRSIGASARMTSRTPSYSQPGYSTLLTGAWPDLNDGPAINVDFADIWPFTQDNLFSSAHRAGLTTAVSGFNWFQRLIPQDALGASFYTAGEDNAADRAVVDAALPWLKEGAYNFVLIHIDQVDFAGHQEGGPRDPRWNAAASRADRLVAEIVGAMDLQRDVLFVASDHGQIDRGGHGGQDPVVLVEPFILAGKGVRPGAYEAVPMVDVAPTLASILGLNQPAITEGKPRTEMMNLTPEWALMNNRASEKQHASLMAAYLAAVGAPAGLGTTDAVRAWLVSSGQGLRLALALLLAAIPLGLVVLRRPQGLAWLLAGAGLADLVFHAYYSLIDGRTYSLSSVDTETQLLATVGIGTMLGFLASALFLFAARARSRNMRSPALTILSFTLTAIYFQAPPVLLSYVINGWNLPGVLPELLSAYLGVLSAIQILLTAFVGLILAAIAGLISFSRSR